MTMPKLGSIPTPILDELQALLERATPAPWMAAGLHIHADETEDRLGFHVSLHCGNRDDTKANARLIARLRNLAPALIAAARQLEEVRRDAERLHALESNSWDALCYDVPTGGGDASVRWCIQEHPARPDDNPELADEATLRAAIDAALLAAQKEQSK